MVLQLDKNARVPNSRLSL